MKKQYVKSYVDQSGKQRHYIRRRGYVSYAMKSEIGTLKFEKEYDHALKSLIPLPDFQVRPRKARALTARIPRWLRSGISGVYFVKGGDKLKIGYSNNIRARVRDLQVGSPFVIHFVGAIINAEPSVERQMHAEFSEYRAHGEWFEYGPRLAEFIALVRTKQRQMLANPTEVI